VQREILPAGDINAVGVFVACASSFTGTFLPLRCVVVGLNFLGLWPVCACLQHSLFDFVPRLCFKEVFVLNSATVRVEHYEYAVVHGGRRDGSVRGKLTLGLVEKARGRTVETSARRLGPAYYSVLFDS
jgi:hypothetical protein